MRFHLLNGDVVDAKAGDYVVVPPRAPHTFSNPHNEEAKFFNTFTPANYIDYFKLLSTLVKAGSPMTPEANRKAMAVSVTSAQTRASFANLSSISQPLVWQTTR